MQLTPHVHLVGSGKFGFELSNDFDCHVFLLDGGSEAALIDAGVGLEVERILDNLRATGIPFSKINKIVLTHAHSDHMGGAGQLRAALDAQVCAPWQAAPWIRSADETAVSLELAKRAGYYPEDYYLQGSPVDVELREGDVVRVGELDVRVLETPGHCSGHCSYVVDADRRLFFGGDLVFYGGTIIAQNIPDCSIQDYARSLFKLEGLGVNALLCGHMTLPLRNGQRHIDMAIQAFRGLMLPKNLL